MGFFGDALTGKTVYLNKIIYPSINSRFHEVINKYKPTNNLLAEFFANFSINLGESIEALYVMEENSLFKRNIKNINQRGVAVFVDSLSSICAFKFFIDEYKVLRDITNEPGEIVNSLEKLFRNFLIENAYSAFDDNMYLELRDLYISERDNGEDGTPIIFYYWYKNTYLKEVLCINDIEDKKDQRIMYDWFVFVCENYIRKSLELFPQL